MSLTINEKEQALKFFREYLFHRKDAVGGKSLTINEKEQALKFFREYLFHRKGELGDKLI